MLPIVPDAREQSRRHFDSLPPRTQRVWPDSGASGVPPDAAAGFGRYSPTGRRGARRCWSGRVRLWDERISIAQTGTGPPSCRPRHQACRPEPLTGRSAYVPRVSRFSTTARRALTSPKCLLGPGLRPRIGVAISATGPGRSPGGWEDSCRFVPPQNTSGRSRPGIDDGFAVTSSFRRALSLRCRSRSAWLLASG